MKLLDVNILLYAHNSEAPQHRQMADWLHSCFTGGEQLAFSWNTLWGFIRIATNSRVFLNPIAPETAFSLVRDWVNRPDVVMLEPGPRHMDILQRLVLDYQAPGPLLTDASIAAIAIEYGATVASTDLHFSRFQNLRWTNPLTL